MGGAWGHNRRCMQFRWGEVSCNHFQCLPSCSRESKTEGEIHEKGNNYSPQRTYHICFREIKVGIGWHVGGEEILTPWQSFLHIYDILGPDESIAWCLILSYPVLLQLIWTCDLCLWVYLGDSFSVWDIFIKSNSKRHILPKHALAYMIDPWFMTMIFLPCGPSFRTKALAGRRWCQRGWFNARGRGGIHCGLWTTCCLGNCRCSSYLIERWWWYYKVLTIDFKFL